MDTEGGRISALLRTTRACVANEALAKAQALSRSKRNCGSCTVLDSTVNKPVPTPSVILSAKVSNCFLYQSPESGVPESVRIARTQQRSLDLSRDPNDPEARFSQYKRKFIEPCPPIPEWYYTAGQPVIQNKSCPLPNKPDNMILPG